MRPKRLQFEWNVLVLVTTALVLFGLVMVYSATSGSAALGNANPLGFVEKQVIYAAIGVGLLVVVSRLPLERLRALAPTLVVTALVIGHSDPSCGFRRDEKGAVSEKRFPASP